MTDLRILYLLLGLEKVNVDLFPFFFFWPNTYVSCEIKRDPSLKGKYSVQTCAFLLRIFISCGCWPPAQCSRSLGRRSDRA